MPGLVLPFDLSPNPLTFSRCSSPCAHILGLFSDGLFKLSIVIKFIVIKVAALVPERSNVHVLRL